MSSDALGQSCRPSHIQDLTSTYVWPIRALVREAHTTITARRAAEDTADNDIPIIVERAGKLTAALHDYGATTSDVGLPLILPVIRTRALYLSPLSSQAPANEPPALETCQGFTNR